LIEVLLSTKKVKDSVFNKSIVLIIRQIEDVFIGVILNKFLGETVNGIWKNIDPNFKEKKNKFIRFGGPLYDSKYAIVVIHKIKKYGEFEIFPKVYVSFKIENIDKIIKNKKLPFEMYIGYCYWKKDQLYEEIKNGNWWILDQKDEHIFNNKDLWQELNNSQNYLINDKLKIKNQNYKMN
jgi:putative AlgH/UPF0301 family transcriptional regulator